MTHHNDAISQLTTTLWNAVAWCSAYSSTIRNPSSLLHSSTFLLPFQLFALTHKHTAESNNFSINGCQTLCSVSINYHIYLSLHLFVYFTWFLLWSSVALDLVILALFFSSAFFMCSFCDYVSLFHLSWCCVHSMICISTLHLNRCCVALFFVLTHVNIGMTTWMLPCGLLENHKLCSSIWWSGLFCEWVNV